jgi:hypothetical protein
MQLPWDEHFHEIVIPAWLTYLGAERRLTEAISASNVERIRRSGYDALREGGAASVYIHHFAEIVLRARPDWLPNAITSPHAVRSWIAPHCTMLRTHEETRDVSLLGDVSDALKHAILTRRTSAREVAENDAVLQLASGYGQLRFCEGKFGGTEQVLVVAKSGRRTLSSILQNVIDSWRRVAGFSLPPIGEP